MTSPITFFVPGAPETEGSTKAYVRGRRAVIVHDNDRLNPWRDRVALTAYSTALRAGWKLPIDAPVVVGVVFYLRRPDRPRFVVPATKPDLDKLQRAIGDALAPQRGRKVLREDSRIVQWANPTKLYAPTPSDMGVQITVKLWEETPCDA